MPCYEPTNVDAQRGNGVFDASIRALQLLNYFGYGRTDDLPLDLVYNPNGAFLPPNQMELEADYKRELKRHFDIDFHRLYTITNMPIGRFASWLRHSGKLETYMQLLIDAFNPASVAGLMCHNTLSVGWRGEVYDCDFNQQLGMQWKSGRSLYTLGCRSRPCRRPSYRHRRPLFWMHRRARIFLRRCACVIQKSPRPFFSTIPLALSDTEIQPHRSLSKPI